MNSANAMLQRTSSLTVVLIDDHAILRGGLKRILEEHHFKVIGEAGNAATAMALLKMVTPDVVILDISLQGVRGIELASNILSIHPGTKIIFLTVHKDEEYVYQALSVGASGYVLKDCLDEEIITALQHVEEGKTYLTPMISSEIARTYSQKFHQTEVWSTFDQLTNREREVLTFICDGKSNKEMAGILNISARTAEHHRQSLMKKLGVNSIADLVKLSIRKKLVEV